MLVSGVMRLEYPAKQSKALWKSSWRRGSGEAYAKSALIDVEHQRDNDVGVNMIEYQTRSEVTADVIAFSFIQRCLESTMQGQSTPSYAQAPSMLYQSSHRHS